MPDQPTPSADDVRPARTIWKVEQAVRETLVRCQISELANNPAEEVAKELDRQGLIWSPLYTSRNLRVQLAEMSKMASDMTDEMMFQAGLVSEVWHLAMELTECLRAHHKLPHGGVPREHKFERCVEVLERANEMNDRFNGTHSDGGEDA